MKPRRILVADDDPNLRLLLVDTLQSIGYDATGVGDGLEVLESVRREPVDMVISDIAMPRLDGFALAERLRQEFPRIYILLITGVTTHESEVKANGERLCDGYLAKPFRIDRIEAMIESVFAQERDVDTGVPTRRVLVVDDDPQFLDAMVETINGLGYHAEGVQDSDSALAAVRQDAAHLVIADVSMPDMNGFDLLKALKRTYPHVPVIMMTGHNLSEPAAALIRERADAYLTKPFHRDTIKAALAKVDPRFTG